MPLFATMLGPAEGQQCEEGLSFAAVASGGVVLIGSVVLFVSSKAVTAGSVLMTVLVSLCGGQLAASLRLLGPGPACGLPSPAVAAAEAATAAAAAREGLGWGWAGVYDVARSLYSASAKVGLGP